MRNRRLAQVAISEDEDDVPPSSRRSGGEDRQRKCKKVRLDDEDEFDIEEEKQSEAKKLKKKKKMEDSEPEAESQNEEEEEPEPEPEAQPIGDVIRVSGKGKGRRNHYASFEYDGTKYDLEDPVLLVPEFTENQMQKPYVAIIKDISQTQKGAMMVTGQWFYRPEEAEKKGGGNWESRDTRELFYSFHRDEVPAESVMHKCVVHFIPLNKQIPKRKEHPGFIVQKVYDTEQKRLFKLTDKDYEDNKQHEIDLLVQKTISLTGDLPDLVPDESAVNHQEDQAKLKRLSRRRNVTPLDVSREDEGNSRSHQSLKAETPGSTAASSSEYYAILSKYKVLTGETQRDRRLEKLLQTIEFLCNPMLSKQNDGKEKDGADGSSNRDKNGSSNHINLSDDKNPNGNKSFKWPDAAVSAITALEKAAHEAFSSDFQKYNMKMRQLIFNIKNEVLARRLLKGELEPAQILNMSPNELKEGLTAEEIASRQPEDAGSIRQMTDARCNRCNEKQVGLIEIIQAGHGDRYHLECITCGNSWYASRDEASTLTIGPSSASTVGTAPLATAKFEDVEKKLVSPRGGPERGSTDGLKKTTEAFVPTLENQKSFNKIRPEDNPAPVVPE